MAEYIEREALLRHLNDIWLSAKPNDSMPDDDRQLAIVRCMGLNDAMDAVKSIPAADVRPVVKATWEEFGDGEQKFYSCSNCFATHYRWDNFCPNCGATMGES